MTHTLNEAIAGSRERELCTVVRRPDRLMARVLDLETDASPDGRTRRAHHAFRSRRTYS